MKHAARSMQWPSIPGCGRPPLLPGLVYTQHSSWWWWWRARYRARGVVSTETGGSSGRGGVVVAASPGGRHQASLEVQLSGLIPLWCGTV